MTHSLRSALFLSTIVFLSTTAFAQVPTGTPPFGSFGGGPVDVVNLSNLNAHIAARVLHKPGRGLPFIYDLSYDTSVWYPVGLSGAQSWQPVYNWGWRGSTESGTGYISRDVVIDYCENPATGESYAYHFVYSDWVYHDSFGGQHPFPGSTEVTGRVICYQGPTNITSLDALATDGSGYTLHAVGGGVTKLASSVGRIFNVPINSSTGAGTTTDRNGNQISVSSAGVFTDTLGTTALTVSGAEPNPVNFTYTTPSGGSASFTMSYVTYSVRTNFGCSGIAEFGPTNVALVDRITLPNSTFYQFTYEPTPGFAGKFTGRLASITLPNGGTIAYTYIGGSGGHITCSDGSASGLTRTVTPGGQWTYARTAGTGAAYTTTMTDPQNNQTAIQFQGIYETQRQIYQGSVSPSNLLRTVTTCYNGNTTDCTGTAISLPITQQTVTIQLGSLQTKRVFFYNGYGLPTEIDDYDYANPGPGPLLRKQIITYAPLGNDLAAFSQSVTVQDGNGVVKFRQDTAYDQPAYSNTPCITGAAQHNDTSYGCTFTNRANPTSVTTYTNPVPPYTSVTKTFTYDSLGNLRTAQLNCCQQRQWNYSSTTQYSYAESVVSGTSPGPQLTVSATYNNSTGLITSSTDENGKVTSYAYDTLLRPLTVTRPDNAQITYSYDPVQHTATVTAPVQGTNTVKQTATLDGLGRPIKVTVKDSSSTSYSIQENQYDSLGRAYKQSNPHNSTPQYWTTTLFDALGRPTSTTLPDNSQTTYTYSDAAGTVTDPANKQGKFQYDALGRLVTVFEPDVSNNNSLTQQTSYTYNVLDQLLTGTQGAQTRTYGYDALGRLTSVATPEAGTVSYQYNDYNLVTQRTDQRGVITNYSYDTLNRLTQISYNVGSTGVPATASVTLTYGTNSAQNNNGRLLTLTDGVGSETYSYDILGGVTQLQKVISATTYTTGYQYNLVGELTQITYPSGRLVQQAYDAIGRLCAVGNSGATCSSGTTFASGFAYNPAFQVTGLSYGNGVSAAFGYSADRLQLTSLGYTKGSQTLLSLSYWYKQDATNCSHTPTGNNGQILCIKENTGTQEAGRSVTYSYDTLYRLTSAVTTGSTSYPKWGLSWTYDRYGNRLNQSQTFDAPPTNSVAVNPATNRITDSGYGYDASGNMTNDGANTLTYDAENRMVTAAGATYTYDGNSLRVKKLSGGTTTVYIFSGTKVLAEYVNGAAPASPTREYIYSGSQLLAKIEAGATNYYHPDHLSARVITDSAGTVTGQRGHYPYGETWYETGTTTKIKFTSYERDSETGSDYAVFRSYVSRLGRFSSPDPLAGSIANPQSLNRHAYSVNDPANLTDPLGLEVEYGGGCEIVCSYLNGQSVGCTARCYEGISGSFDSGIVNLGLGKSGGGGGGGDPPNISGPIPGGNADLSKLIGPPKEPPCPVNAQSLNAYLQGKGSPLAGQGNVLADAGSTYNVDPRFVVALAGAETSFGRNITRGQYNAWNWFYRGPNERNHPFSGWQEGINRVTRGIGGRNYFQADPPRTNTSSIYERYCQGPDCPNGLRNLNTFLTQQGGDPNALRFPCR